MTHRRGENNRVDRRRLYDGDGLCCPWHPVFSGCPDLVAWVVPSRPRFPDSGSAIDQLAQMSGAEATPAFAAYVHEVMAEADGEVRSTTSPEPAADTLLACTEEDRRHSPAASESQPCS